MGATTGRKRRVGYPDWVRIRRAVMLNDADGIYLTRADCVQDHDVKVGIGYVVNGEVTNEAPFDDSRIESVVYDDKIFNWNLWAGTRDVSNPELVDDKLRIHRKAYVNAGFNSLPEDLKKFVELHDNYVGVPTVGISIGPSRGETVLRNISLD
jgi:adenylosuccinate synthase